MLNQSYDDFSEELPLAKNETPVTQATLANFTQCVAFM